MPATFPPSRTVVTPEAGDYRDREWTVAETANGACLITDERVAAVELTGAMAADVRRYLRANNLSGPILEFPGAERREIHLVVGIAKAARAIEALRGAGVTVHSDGASIPLPPTRLSAGSPEWAVSPTEARWIPPLVALAAAVHATNPSRHRLLAELAC
ncbi:hypothetical protein DFR70_102348 [Nocardia tenerifensis]|uniref:Bifunctional DNA primase/polymerase-like protein n=1 Tax=Nocardia tenerifensis TaxID=228006 RepID=A0A318K7K7_9NOCA|nr:hypothetical protein DFR70_102348 [Nocardia tenerifensis]